MNLGNKTLNNLISKDGKISQNASYEIINGKDVESFEILNSKADFLFDYIKEKILKNLIYSVNKDNCKALFDFCKVYSPDFKNYILEPLIKFQDEEITSKMYEFLKSGTSEEKTYAIEFFTILNNIDIIPYAKKCVVSNFEPLRISAIKSLKKFKEKEEYEKNLKILSDGDELEKLEAVDFLVNYGDCEAFDKIYNFFLSDYSEFTATNLLCLKSLEELIKEDKTEQILNILGSILRGTPDNITFSETLYYFQNNILNFLLEEESNPAQVLIYYLKVKLELWLEDESYVIDIDNNDKKEGIELKNKVNSLLAGFNYDEIIKTALKSKNKLEIIIGEELAGSDFSEELQDLVKSNNDYEIILNAVKNLKSNNNLTKEIVDTALSKIKNDNIGAEIKNLLN